MPYNEFRTIIGGWKMEKNKHLGLIIDAETHRKLKSLAEANYRSINAEILFLIRNYIKSFEKKRGPLE